MPLEASRRVAASVLCKIGSFLSICQISIKVYIGEVYITPGLVVGYYVGNHHGSFKIINYVIFIPDPWG